MGTPRKIRASLFPSFFLIAGIAGIVLILLGITYFSKTRSWTKTPCRITQSEIRISDDTTKDEAYLLDLAYSYEFSGKHYLSSQYQKDKKEIAFQSYAQVAREQAKFPVGQEKFCYVNPANPEMAVLDHDPMWFIFLIFVPIIFVIVGARGIYGVWRKPGTVNGLKKRSILDPRFFYSIFFLGGAGFLIPFFVPLYTYATSYNWISTPCKVVMSCVRSSSDGDEGPTFRADVLYEYTFDGKVYRSNQFGFMDGSSSGNVGKIETVKEYSKGKNTKCWVNSADPNESVLSRAFPLTMLFAGIPLVCIVGGAWSFIGRWGMNKGYAKRGGLGNWHRYKPGKPVLLIGFGRRFMKPAIGLFAALFWNGIVSVFIYKIYSNWRFRPNHQISELFSCESVFMIPFVLIGLGMIGYEIYLLLGLLNPSTRINVSGRGAYAGTELGIGWKISGWARRVKKLTILFEGREMAMSQQGTMTKTIYREWVFESDKLEEFESGQARVDLSGVIMPTVDSGNNKIRWYLCVKGEIPNWPDINDEFEIDIWPADAKKGLS